MNGGGHITEQNEVAVVVFLVKVRCNRTSVVLRELVNLAIAHKLINIVLGILGQIDSKVGDLGVVAVYGKRICKLNKLTATERVVISDVVIHHHNHRIFTLGLRACALRSVHSAREQEAA